MIFRVANPPMRRKSRKKRSAAQKAAFKKMIAALKRSKKSSRRRTRRTNPKKNYTMARRKRSRRSSRRRSNPLLAIGNPRRRRRSRRSRSRLKHVIMLNPRRRRSRRSRRYSNPTTSFKSYVSTSILTDAAWGAGGFAFTKLARGWVTAFYPAGLTPTMEGALNVGVEVASAAAGGMLTTKFAGRGAGRAFAIGGLLYATWTLVGLVTGKPMSLSEYVAPRSTGRLRYGNNRRMGVASYPRASTSSSLAAYPRALPKAF